jgi:pilus assembly protein CpaB
VLVAAKDILEGARLEPEMVETVARPADAIQPHALTRPQDAVGQIAVVPLYKGEQVLGSKLERVQSARTLSMKLTPGKRAVTIDVDALTGVGGFIRPGDFVDVLGVFKLPTPDGKQAGVTVTLLQRVPVLAVGAQLEEGGGPAAKQTEPVTLALNPKETELILFARAQGQIQLALRSKADAQIVEDLPPMTIDTLVALILGPQLLQQAQAQPQPPPEAPSEPERKERRVEVYRGLDKEEVVVFSEVPP